ncbi:hypothetical protein M9H77_31314 [Catharanthus roseus]|uniref:Uncharacterized protein n=1 Tax=Catharanthus roseus TaxID=4058 RepID=A0ACC0A100_CATRO|nr:hypothetical protein M9H77_31314 [Catharanthus roseus]
MEASHLPFDNFQSSSSCCPPMNTKVFLTPFGYPSSSTPRAQPNRDSTPPTSNALMYRLNHSKGLVGGTGDPCELACTPYLRLLRHVVDSFIRERNKGPKHGRCHTLEWQRQKRDLTFCFKACSDIQLPRKIKLVRRVMGNEGVGLASYLLNHFWFTRLQAGRAAIKAILINRTFQPFLLVLVPHKFLNFLQYEIECNNSYLYFTSYWCCWEICIDRIAYLVTRWYEGPIPVSALIHAATMVTAGVFTIVRCSPLF